MTVEPNPSLQIDSDWKAQAQAEKDRLTKDAQAKKAESAAKAKTAAGTAGATGGETSGGQKIPEATFEVLLSTVATQALFALGGIPDPRTGQRMKHLGLARHHIDLLAVLQEKTQGNLSKDEATMINQTLYELRQRYIQASTEERNA
ncbi:MAG: DUF1844 domain-containing protein [Phycisphaeraceae bacterium]|nr:DUF1844 domain-containing protein [Phycisphaeraceae bacterium]